MTLLKYAALVAIVMSASPALAGDTHRVGGPVLPDDMAAIGEAYRTAINSGGDMAGFFAEDAVMLSPFGGQLEGREAIVEFLSRVQTYAGDLQSEVTGFLDYGTTAVANGNWSWVVNGPNGEMPLGGQWLWLVERGTDGAVQIKRNIYNQSMSN